MPRSITQTRRALPYAVSTFAGYGILLLGLVTALGAAGFDLSRVSLLLSALGVGIGFGLQEVVKDFVARVRERAIGHDILDNINAGQQVVKIVNDELTAMLGAGDRTFRLIGQPAVVMLVGLQGSGKTTSAAKLARFVAKQGRQPLLVAADPYRPAAVDQLVALGKGLDIPVYRAEEPNTPVLEIVRQGIDRAKQTGRDVVILDTAGRLTVEWDIAGGDVAEVRVTEDSIRDGELVTCVKTRSARWKFPAGTTATIAKVFIFQARPG